MNCLQECKKDKDSFEAFYSFVKESLLALQPSGFGVADFTCPICGKAAHIRRIRKHSRTETHIGCNCGTDLNF